jgi:hypothetical protein
MFRSGLILALVAAGWLAGASRCAAQEAPLPPRELPLPVGDPLAEPPPESWPAGSIESQARTPLFTWLSQVPIILPAMPALPETAPLERHRGLGNPLVGTSWCNRPWYFGAFFGGALGSDLTAGIEKDVGVLGGWRMGYDADFYWGWESRIAFAYSAIDDGQPPPARHLEEWYFDGSLMYYPWGDAQWRPFFSLGGGAALVDFHDGDGVRYNETLFQIPIAFGVKYLYDRWFALRADLTQNVLFGAGGLNGRDNVSATAGFEVHFGARPRSYFPW